nr:unnamed protein product [Callosobruchus analis]
MLDQADLKLRGMMQAILDRLPQKSGEGNIPVLFNENAQHSFSKISSGALDQPSLGFWVAPSFEHVPLIDLDLTPPIEAQVRVPALWSAHFKTGSVMRTFRRSSPANDILAKSDMSLGLMSWSLRKIGAKFPDAVTDIQHLITASNAEFRSVSDDPLQYTCDRRVEIIKLRQKAFRPGSDYMTSLPHAIPPSLFHLFEEGVLAVLLRKHTALFFRFSSS